MTLKNIFETNSSALVEKLSSMSLPADSQRVQSVIAEYFNTLLDENGEYRENLTQSEDYILQSAIALLNAQQKMAQELSSHSSEQAAQQIAPVAPTINAEMKSAKKKVDSEKYPHVMAGSAIGSVGGALVLGTWGALFGAIAGTALVLYAVSSSAEEKSDQYSYSVTRTTTDKQESSELNVAVLLSIIGSICDSVDELIATFRSQIKKVVHKYENQEKPSIERDYRFLLEGIQSLLGYKRTHSEEEEKYIKKLQLRIEDVGELLENYNLEVVDYDGENEQLFEVVTGQDVDAPRMVFPAIVKNGVAVLKGKIFKK